jgi:hypothetical protein
MSPPSSVSKNKQNKKPAWSSVSPYFPKRDFDLLVSFQTVKLGHILEEFCPAFWWREINMYTKFFLRLFARPVCVKYSRRVILYTIYANQAHL